MLKNEKLTNKIVLFLYYVIQTKNEQALSFFVGKISFLQNCN